MGKSKMGKKANVKKQDLMVLTRNDVLKMASAFESNERLAEIHLPIAKV